MYVSTETGIEAAYTYRALHREVNRMAACLQALGVRRGDRVLIYLPMIPEAAFAMLACARIGAIHSVVFGGFASNSLATRIDDATPRVIVSADAGSRAGKVVEYKPLLDAAIDLAAHKPAHVLLVDRGLAPVQHRAHDVDYATLARQHAHADVPCEWMESNEPSYILYTSGTTGRPKGVQRDTGGYAVALAASMPLIFGAQAGDTMFTASDVGWVVGHSYIVYAPLLAGLTTVMYEGTPVRPDGAVWWRIVEQYRVNVMFTAPTAIRVLKRQDPALLHRHDLSSLRRLFLAGEPLDEPTARWIGDALGKPIVDNYWQTETGWPMLAIPQGVEPSTPKLGSPGFPVYGYKLDILDEATGQPCAPGEKGLLAVAAPLPPGCMTTVWGDDARFLRTYWSAFPGRPVYSSFDWGVRDDEGYITILGRTDDVINVAGHRLGTRDRREPVVASGHRRGGGGGRGRSAERAGGDGVCHRARRGAHCRAGRPLDAGGRADAHGGRAIGRRGAAVARVFCQCAAEDAFGQAAAPGHAGGGRRARSGRPDHHRGSDRAGPGARGDAGVSACADRRADGAVRVPDPAGVCR